MPDSWTEVHDVQVAVDGDAGRHVDGARHHRVGGRVQVRYLKNDMVSLNCTLQRRHHVQQLLSRGILAE